MNLQDMVAKRKIKNMKYSLLLKLLQDAPITFSFPPQPLTTYCIPYGRRVCIENIYLLPNHNARYPVVHKVNGVALVSQGFLSTDISSTRLLYCAWIEDCPHVICLWEGDKELGICRELHIERFNQSSFVTACMSNLMLNSPIHHERPLQLEGVDNEIIHNYYRNYSTDDDDDRVTMEFLIDFQMMQRLFVEARDKCGLLLARQHRQHRNLDKILFGELKSAWELKCVEAEQITSELLWTFDLKPSIWLFVLGCPRDIYSIGALLIRLIDILSSDDCQYQSTIKVLVGAGFEEGLATWIYSCICIDYSSVFDRVEMLGSDILQRNSMLGQNQQGYAHSYHIHQNGDGYSSTLPEDIQLKVIGKELQTPLIALPFNSANLWYPGDFAQYAFNSIQAKLAELPGFECYGHCCAEQSVIAMCQTGMSPYAGFQNHSSCGHGMYFFRLCQTQRSYSDLSHGAEEHNVVGDCFRTFMYATLRMFESRTIHTHAPAILLFFVPLGGLAFFDAVHQPLPLKNCNCKSGLQISVEEERIERLSGDAGLTPQNVVELVNCCEDVEMKNAIALMSGVVDFAQIQPARFVANVADNQLKLNHLPPKILKDLLRNGPGYVNESLIPSWKLFVQPLKKESRRPYVLCNINGRPVKRSPYTLLPHPHHPLE